MNAQETTGTTTELDIRELTATELDHAAGGLNFAKIEWKFTTSLAVCSENNHMS